MKKLNLAVVTTALALMACGQREAAPSPEAIDVAAKYCAQDFKPYFSILKACNAEANSGKRGASCATSDQVDAILERRQQASGFKECPSPEVRWGPNANKN